MSQQFWWRFLPWILRKGIIKSWDHGVGKALKGHIVVVLNENKTILIPLEKADI